MNVDHIFSIIIVKKSVLKDFFCEYCLKYYMNNIFKYCTKITYCCMFFMNKCCCSKHQRFIILSQSNNFPMTEEPLWWPFMTLSRCLINNLTQGHSSIYN